MAQEARRACGYRKVGGLYLCADAPGMPCCKLPVELRICPVCNSGIKQSRGFRWIDPKPWLHGDCISMRPCPAADPSQLGERIGLIWIGAEFYPTPAAFMAEANTMGISRRIQAVPRDFKLGETWVAFAHPRVKDIVDAATGAVESIPGVFQFFRPTRIEKIVTATQATDEAAMAKLAKAGITPVIVPDDDRDHQGSVYDKQRAEKRPPPDFKFETEPSETK